MYTFLDTFCFFFFLFFSPLHHLLHIFERKCSHVIYISIYIYIWIYRYGKNKRCLRHGEGHVEEKKKGKENMSDKGYSFSYDLSYQRSLKWAILEFLLNYDSSAYIGNNFIHYMLRMKVEILRRYIFFNQYMEAYFSLNLIHSLWILFQISTFPNLLFHHFHFKTL